MLLLELDPELPKCAVIELTARVASFLCCFAG